LVSPPSLTDLTSFNTMMSEQPVQRQFITKLSHTVTLTQTVRIPKPSLPYIAKHRLTRLPVYDKPFGVINDERECFTESRVENARPLKVPLRLRDAYKFSQKSNREELSRILASNNPRLLINFKN